METIDVVVNGEEITLDVNSIVYVESIKHYLYVYTINKYGILKTYKIRGKISEWNDILAENNLIRIHQSIIVNPNRIVNLIGQLVYVRCSRGNVVSLPISRPYKNERREIKRLVAC